MLIAARTGLAKPFREPKANFEIVLFELTKIPAKSKELATVPLEQEAMVISQQGISASSR
jgi:hypothetical protein